LANSIFGTALSRCDNSLTSEFAHVTKIAARDLSDASLPDQCDSGPDAAVVAEHFAAHIFKESGHEAHVLNMKSQTKSAALVDDTDIVSGATTDPAGMPVGSYLTTICNSKSAESFPGFSDGANSDGAKSKPIPIPNLSSTISNVASGEFEQSHDPQYYQGCFQEKLGSVLSSNTVYASFVNSARLTNNPFHSGFNSARSNSGNGPHSSFRVAGSFVDTPRSILSNPDVEYLMQEHMRSSLDEVDQNPSSHSGTDDDEFLSSCSSSEETVDQGYDNFIEIELMF
jgi:hypothetical protein